MVRSLILAALLGPAALAQGVPLDLEPPDEPEEAEAEPVEARPPLRVYVGGAEIRRGPSRLDGPRVGITVLDPGTVEAINEAFDEERISGTSPVITQFGWQFETRLFQAESGLTGVTEIVGLVGGLDRNLVLPSGTFLVGLRTPTGLEVGMGPNVTLAGTGYAVAAGVSTSVGGINVPVNVAAVFGRGGPRLSLLAGFTLSSRRY